MLAADTVVIAIVTRGHLVMVKIAYLEFNKSLIQHNFPPFWKADKTGVKRN